MADPHIKSPMDWLDYTTIVIYRLGFTLVGPMVIALGWQLPIPAEPLLFLCGAMCASSLHIYMKNFRLLLQFATWVGLVCFILGAPMFGLGGIFITLGGLCYKEYFCFQIPGLRLQPILVALLWFGIACDWELVAKVSASLSGLLFLIVTIAKWRMPLHFDMGDKTRYEI
ncbi:DUF2301 domain-containing membrane protein [Vibrio sp. RC27]